MAEALTSSSRLMLKNELDRGGHICPGSLTLAQCLNEVRAQQENLGDAEVCRRQHRHQAAELQYQRRTQSTGQISTGSLTPVLNPACDGPQVPWGVGRGRGAKPDLPGGKYLHHNCQQRLFRTEQCHTQSEGLGVISLDDVILPTQVSIHSGLA